MKKRLTYWSVLRSYHRELYKINSYWIGAAFLVLALALLIGGIRNPSAQILVATTVSLVIGIGFVFDAKLKLLKKEISV